MAMPLSSTLAGLVGIILSVAMSAPIRPAQAVEPPEAGSSLPVERRPPSKSTQYGVASWYGPGFEKRKTASGERFAKDLATAAHRHLPLGTRVLVTNLTNGLTAIVRINDRGPYVRGRVIDLSASVARQLAMVHKGLTRVSIEVLD